MTDPRAERGPRSLASVDRRTVALLALAVAAAHGVAAPAALGAQVEERDSLGVEIVETEGRRARAASGVTVQREPELQIGELDGDLAYLFSDIYGIALLRGERIVVLERAESELRFYDLQGEFVGRRGGAGAGPGEFLRARLFQTTPGDSLLIYDRAARRFTMYSSSGDGFRTFSGQVGGGRLAGASGTRVVMVSARGPLLLPGVAYGPFVTDLEVRLVDVAQETSDIMATTPYQQVRTPNPIEGGPPYIMLAPFTYTPAVAVDRDGFFLTTPREPSVLEYSWTGELRRIIRLLEPRNEVTEAEFRTAIDRRVDRMVEGAASASVERAIRRAYDDVDPPDTEPTFQSLIVDDEGWLWAQTYQESSDDAVTWLLFDPDGRGRGSVVMPEDLSVSSISRDYVLGVWRDEFDVEYVRLHRIDGLER